MAADLELAYGQTYQQPPLSPTLTNPDMILPDSPDQQDALTPTRRNPYSHAPAHAIQSPSRDAFANAEQAGALLHKVSMPFASARPLSDIAEVDPTPRKVAYHSDTLASSPTLDAQSLPLWKQRPERRLSDDASSVKSEELEQMRWPGFDSSGGADAANALDIDDEEQFGQFPVDMTPPDETGDEDDWLGTRDHGASDKGADVYEQDALSRRADIILANAKKRLNLMEGNLRGARNSLLSAPSTTLSRSYSALGSNQSRDKYGSRTIFGHRTRQFSPSPLSSISTLGHARVTSDLSYNLTGSGMTNPKRQMVQKRASSAMGGYLPVAYHNSEQPSLRNARSHEVMRDNRVHMWMMNVERPLHDAQPPESLLGTPRSHRSQNPSVSGSDVHQLDPIEGSPSGSLRSQIDELKGKITSLKDRAKEDNVKRLSQGSAREQSPSASAENWYHKDPAYNAPSISSDAGIGSLPQPFAPSHSIAEAEQHANDSDQVNPAASTYSESNYEDADEDIDHDSDEPYEPFSDPLESYEGGSDEEGYTDSTTDAASEYFDSVPVAERHEDREDAFDYENFFLHSAMGTYSREQRRMSLSSNDSVETTRPIHDQQEEKQENEDEEAILDSAEEEDATPRDLGSEDEKRITKDRTPRRMQSADSISTIDTFMTADEHNGSDDEDDDTALDAATRHYLSSQMSSGQPPSRAAPPPAALFSQKPRRLVDSGVHVIPGQINGPRSPLTPHSTTEAILSLICPANPTFLSANSSPSTSSSAGSAGSSGSAVTAQGPRTPTSFPLLQKDIVLLKQLVQGLQGACVGMQAVEGESWERKEWRRRVDGCVKLLAGQEGGDAMRESSA